MSPEARIEGCTFKWVDGALHISAKGIRVEGCTFHECAAEETPDGDLVLRPSNGPGVILYDPHGTDQVSERSDAA